MGWFGFLFGKKKIEQDSTPIDRAPRVRVIALHNIGFISNQPSHSEKPIRISNLSVTGVGFIRDSREAWPEEGSSIKGEFIFPDGRIEASVIIQRVTDGLVGGSFEGDASTLDPLRKTIARYFALELSALRMEEVNSELLRPEPDGRPRLFRGEDNCELFVVEDRDELVRFNLTFFGNFIEGSTDRTMEFGNLSGEGSDFIVSQRKLPEELIDCAVKFVKNIKTLEKDRSEEIVALIRRQK